MEEQKQVDRARLEAVREAGRRAAREMEAACRGSASNMSPAVFAAGYIVAMQEVEMLLVGIHPTGPRWDRVPNDKTPS